MNTEQERAAFEEEIRDNWGFAKLERAGEDYIDPETQGLWGLWKARAALQAQDREDAERYRYLIAKLQQAYDGDYFETDLMSLYCQMPSQYKGERIVRAEITWRDKTDEPIGLSEAIDHARRAEVGV